MYLDEQNILNSIQILKGEKTADELTMEQKKEWGLSSQM